MWVFNGEEWVDNDAGEWSAPKKSEASRPRYDEMMPELQVIEIVRVPRNTDVPPLPMP